MKLYYSSLIPAVVCSLLAPVQAENWPCFRGPSRQGVTEAKNLPLKWTETEGVKWKTEVPGEGHSSPVVWGDRIFLTTAVAYGEPVPTPMRPGQHDNIRSMNKQEFVVLASALFFSRVKGDVTHREWPGLYHEIHNEKEQNEVFDYTLDWMKKQGI